VLKKTDMVFHLAGVTKARDAQAYFAGNVQTTKNLLDACEKFSRLNKNLFSFPARRLAVPAQTIADHRSRSGKSDLSLSAARNCKPKILVLNTASIATLHHSSPFVYGPRDRDILTYFASANRGILPLLG
jgi:hypothetical protein